MQMGRLYKETNPYSSFTVFDISFCLLTFWIINTDLQTNTIVHGAFPLSKHTGCMQLGLCQKGGQYIQVDLS